MPTREAIFDVWAPSTAVWSPWVKPVLFAHMRRESAGAEVPTHPPPNVDVTWAPGSNARTAIVVDLPASLGVSAGLALAEIGYRPVPLYNAAPGPTGPALLGGLPSDLRVSLVDVWSILNAIVSGTGRLSALCLPDDAPPAFLLDAERRTGTGAATAGRFDNRSVSFVTDFPSGNFLRSRSIERVLVVQSAGEQPQPDLAHTLLRWQEAGIAIELKRMDEPGPAGPCTVTRPGRLASLWARFLAVLKLRRNPLGGFGGIVPEPSSG